MVGCWLDILEIVMKNARMIGSFGSQEENNNIMYDVCCCDD